MVDVTLLEVNLEDAEFTANAPFSGREGKSKAGRTVSKMLGRSGGSESSERSGSPLSKLTAGKESKAEEEDAVEIDIEEDSDDNPASFAPVLLLGALVAVLVVLRRLRRGGSEDERELVDYET